MFHRMLASCLIGLTFAFACVTELTAQEQKPSSTHIEAMKKLSFLEGEWKGEGWNEFVPGQRRKSPITEMVHYKLGGVVLSVEGIGKTRIPGQQEEVVVHHAVGILSYDAKAQLYRMRSYLMNGQSVDAEAKFTDAGFQWGFQPAPTLHMRYTVKLNDKSEWFEIGEMSQDGTSWRKFHEMTLQKVK